MKTAPAAKKRSLSATDWILLSFAALLFHLLLFTLFVPTEPEKETRTARSRFTLMLQNDPLLLQKEADPYKLRYSLLYMNPEDLVKADSVNGFSRILQRQRISLPTPGSCPHKMYDQKSFFPAQKDPILPEERFLDSFSVSSSHLQKIRPRTGGAQKAPLLRYPVWIDHTGKVTAGLFLEDSQSRRIFERYKDRARSVAFLRLDTEKGKIPSVMIRRSCGVPELDQLALRQLSARKENYSAGEGKKSIFYQVIWHGNERSFAEGTQTK